MIELNGFHRVFFFSRVCLETLMVLTVIQVGCSQMLIPKKCALNVNLSLCVSLCAIYAQNCVYMRV